MDASLTIEPKRRVLAIRTASGFGELAALDFGDPARPIDVIFLHANGFNAMTYRTVLTPLSERLRILAIDQQGHGRTPAREPIEGRLNWLGYRDDLAALLDSLDQPPVVLSGHSMGGTACILAAAERPERIRALGLFDPVIAPEATVRRILEGGERLFDDSVLARGARRRRTGFSDRAEAFASYHGRGVFKTWPDQALRDYITDGFRDLADGGITLSCARDWEAANYANQAHDSWSALRRLHCPVTILRAEDQSTCSIDSADPFIADNPALRVTTIAGTTHFLPIERPDLVGETLTNLTA